MAIFVRFKQGTRLDVESDLFEAIRTFLDKLGATGDVQGALRGLIRYEAWDTVRPDVLSTWFALVQEFLELHRNVPARYAAHLGDAQLTCLASLALGGKPEELWNRVRPLLIKEIEYLSGWDFSSAKACADLLQVQKDEEGAYYREEIGSRVRILGARTAAETKVEYLVEQARGEYGYLHQVSRFVALCNISSDFRDAREGYPDSIRIVLPEDYFLSYSWYILSPAGSPRIPWRPPSRYCDPDFLAADLVGQYTQQNPLPGVPSPPVTKATPHEQPCQYEFALDTNLRIGTEDEASLTFQGQSFRWINGSREYCPVLIVGVRTLQDYATEIALVNELLSILCYETRIPIIATFATGGRTRLLPSIRQPRKLADSVYPSGVRVEFAKPVTAARRLALALYREGKSSKSVYYGFLSYYKILQIPFAGKQAAEVEGWINSHAKPEGTLASRRVRELNDEGIINVGKYLYQRWRNAIAHVHEPTINPDDHELRLRMSQDIWLVEDLSRVMIESDLLD